MFVIPDAQLSMLVVCVCKFVYCIFNVPDPKCHVVKWPAPGSPYYPGNSSLFTTHTAGPKTALMRYLLLSTVTVQKDRERERK